jgi:hypothetical protein
MRSRESCFIRVVRSSRTACFVPSVAVRVRGTISKTRRLTLRARSRMRRLAGVRRGPSRFSVRVSTRTPSASSVLSVA